MVGGVEGHRYPQRIADEYVIARSKVKVFLVTNDSDVAIEDVRVQIIASSASILAPPVNLKWRHSYTERTDIAARTTVEVVLGFFAQVETNLPGGDKHDWIKPIEWIGFGTGSTITVRAWAPAANGESKTFRFESRVPEGRPNDLLMLPNLSEVAP